MRKLVRTILLLLMAGFLVADDDVPTNYEEKEAIGSIAAESKLHEIKREEPESTKANNEKEKGNAKFKHQPIFGAPFAAGKPDLLPAASNVVLVLDKDHQLRGKIRNVRQNQKSNLGLDNVDTNKLLSWICSRSQALKALTALPTGAGTVAGAEPEPEAISLNEQAEVDEGESTEPVVGAPRLLRPFQSGVLHFPLLNILHPQPLGAKITERIRALGSQFSDHFATDSSNVLELRVKPENFENFENSEKPEKRRLAQFRKRNAAEYSELGRIANTDETNAFLTDFERKLYAELKNLKDSNQLVNKVNPAFKLRYPLNNIDHNEAAVQRQPIIDFYRRALKQNRQSSDREFKLNNADEYDEVRKIAENSGEQMEMFKSDGSEKKAEQRQIPIGNIEAEFTVPDSSWNAASPTTAQLNGAVNKNLVYPQLYYNPHALAFTMPRTQYRI